MMHNNILSTPVVKFFSIPFWYLKRTHLFFLFLAALFLAGVAQASVPRNVTFGWQANPPEDNIVEYRLYYGSKSRFDSQGKPKANFSYDYYINVADSTLCDNVDNSAGCTVLGPNDLNCDNIYSDNPTCTLNSLEGTFYFALTACSSDAESDYTYELVVKTNSAGPGIPPNTSSITAMLNTLLLKK